MKKKHYAIFRGHQSGVVVDTWAVCEVLVKGFSGAIYRGFPAHQKAGAEAFAKNGPGPKKSKPQKPRPQRKQNPTWKTTERKSYRDPSTGVFYKDRPVRKQGPTMTGANFKPHIGTSCPFEPDSEDAAELRILASARDKI